MSETEKNIKQIAKNITSKSYLKGVEYGYSLAQKEVIELIDTRINVIVDAFNIEENYKHKIELGTAYEVLKRIKERIIQLKNGKI